MTKISPMRRAVGLVLMFIGVMWFLMGVGFIGGSQFSNNTVFAILGALIASAGVVVMQYGIKRKPTSPPEDEDPDS